MLSSSVPQACLQCFTDIYMPHAGELELFGVVPPGASYTIDTFEVGLLPTGVHHLKLSENLSKACRYN